MKQSTFYVLLALVAFVGFLVLRQRPAIASQIWNNPYGPDENTGVGPWIGYSEE